MTQPGVVCPKCGHAELTSEVFCSECGIPLEPARIVQAPRRRKARAPHSPMGHGCLIGLVVALVVAWASFQRDPLKEALLTTLLNWLIWGSVATFVLYLVRPGPRRTLRIIIVAVVGLFIIVACIFAMSGYG